MTSRSRSRSHSDDDSSDSEVDDVRVKIEPPSPRDKSKSKSRASKSKSKRHEEDDDDLAEEFEKLKVSGSRTGRRESKRTRSRSRSRERDDDRESSKHKKHEWHLDEKKEKPNANAFIQFTREINPDIQPKGHSRAQLNQVASWFWNINNKFKGKNYRGSKELTKAEQEVVFNIHQRRKGKGSKVVPGQLAIRAAEITAEDYDFAMNQKQTTTSGGGKVVTDRPRRYDTLKQEIKRLQELQKEEIHKLKLDYRRQVNARRRLRRGKTGSKNGDSDDERTETDEE